MAWKGRKSEQIDFNQLISSLNTSGLQKERPALYQVVWQLIQNAQRNKGLTVQSFNEIDNSINTIGDTINNIINNIQDATFWTENNETVKFPASVRVIAGTSITLDYSVPNQVTINSTGGGGVLPMVNGAEPPQLMSNGAGDLIIIPFNL